MFFASPEELRAGLVTEAGRRAFEARAPERSGVYSYEQRGAAAPPCPGKGRCTPRIRGIRGVQRPMPAAVRGGSPRRAAVPRSCSGNVRGPSRCRKRASELVGVAGFEPTASSSRTPTTGQKPHDPRQF
jgi:hypothetical protein